MLKGEAGKIDDLFIIDLSGKDDVEFDGGQAGLLCSSDFPKDIVKLSSSSDLGEFRFVQGYLGSHF